MSCSRRIHSPAQAPEARARSLVVFASFVSLVMSVVLWFGGHRAHGIFVGLWLPSILSLGAVLLPRSER